MSRVKKTGKAGKPKKLAQDECEYIWVLVPTTALTGLNEAFGAAGLRFPLNQCPLPHIS